MKICIVQTRPVKGDVPHNLAVHKDFIDTAVSNGADVVIFPELSLTGYEPSLAKELATHQEDGRFAEFQTVSDTSAITIGVGMPTKAADGTCISMVLFQPHQARQTYSKKYIHADEEPFFVCGQNFPVLPVNGTRIGLAICYELSVPEHAEAAFANGAEVYLTSVAKSARGVTQAAERLAWIAQNYAVPVLMSNCTGPSEDFVSAGNTAVWNKNGQLLAQLDDTSEGCITFDTDSETVIAKTL